MDMGYEKADPPGPDENGSIHVGLFSKEVSFSRVIQLPILEGLSNANLW